MQVMKQDELPFSNIAHEFVGADHGDVGVCLILVDAPPGRVRMVSIQATQRFATEWLED